MIEEVAGDIALFEAAALLEAAALVMFSQPSMQPAPAIQSATVNASATRMIFIEEKDLILMRSVAS